jgi:hypothetical protein
MLAVLGACSVDLGKLRSPLHKDAASSTDLYPSHEDVASPNRDAAASLDDGGEVGASLTWPDAQREGGFDSDPIVADGAGIDRSAGTGDSAEASDDNDAGASSGWRAESGPELAADRAGVDVGGDGPEPISSSMDTGTAFDSDGAVDVPRSGGPEAADSGAGADNAYDGDAAADGQVAIVTGVDAISADARGKKTCPTTLTGSIDLSDATQLGRLSRIAPVSACGTMKILPGSAETTYLHFYDAYHFINPTGAPICFDFTLTYPGSQQLYGAVYSVYDPTNIATGYLGDVGGVLTSPQTMGITVDAGESIDVVVYAISASTAAGSYTLSCGTE